MGNSVVGGRWAFMAPFIAIVLAFAAGSSHAEPSLRGSIVLKILAFGGQAEQNGDVAGLLKAANALRQTGAHPVDGEEDLAARWVNIAMQRGGRPQAITPYRGRTLGPGYKSGVVLAHARFLTHQSFNGGQRAEILVTPKSAASLSLRVADDQGVDVCSLAASSETMGCEWVPPFTARHDIEIDNEGTSPASFYLVLN